MVVRPGAANNAYLMLHFGGRERKRNTRATRARMLLCLSPTEMQLGHPTSIASCHLLHDDVKQAAAKISHLQTVDPCISSNTTAPKSFAAQFEKFLLSATARPPRVLKNRVAALPRLCLWQPSWVTGPPPDLRSNVTQSQTARQRTIHVNLKWAWPSSGGFAPTLTIDAGVRHGRHQVTTSNKTSQPENQNSQRQSPVCQSAKLQ
jgi:hypothetical protein